MACASCKPEREISFEIFFIEAVILIVLTSLYKSEDNNPWNLQRLHSIWKQLSHISKFFFIEAVKILSKG